MLGTAASLTQRRRYHPDVEFLPLRAATEGGYHGLSGIESFVSDTFDVFDKFEVTPASDPPRTRASTGKDAPVCRQLAEAGLPFPSRGARVSYSAL